MRPKYKKETTIALMDAFIEENGRYPTSSEMRSIDGCPFYSIVCNHLGMSPRKYYQQKCQRRLLLDLRAYLDNNGVLLDYFKNTDNFEAQDPSEREKEFVKITKVLPENFLLFKEALSSSELTKSKVTTLYATFIAYYGTLPESDEVASWYCLPSFAQFHKLVGRSPQEYFDPKKKQATMP